MLYENMPLYPGMRPAGNPDACMRVRLFEDGCGHRPPPMRECERVTIDNPCCPGQRAEVTLGVDDCGSLVICVHRLRRAPCDRCDPCCRHDPCDRPDPFEPCDPCPCPDACGRPIRPRPPRRRRCPPPLLY